MRVLIHDLDERELSALGEFKEDTTVVAANGRYAPCKGCFKCWLKNRGYCVMTDSLQHIGALIGSSDEVVIISKNCYGCYSPTVKNVLDRAISVSLPFFTYRNGRIHHMLRYKNEKTLRVFMYGDFNELEQDAARRMVAANAVNLGAKTNELITVPSPARLAGVTK